MQGLRTLYLEKLTDSTIYSTELVTCIIVVVYVTNSVIIPALIVVACLCKVYDEETLPISITVIIPALMVVACLCKVYDEETCQSP